MKQNKYWIITIFSLTFILSILFSAISNVMASSFNDFILFIILFVVILLGILFDAIGTSAITGSESAFHAMNSQKIKGAKEALNLIKNSEKIATVCNDVVGDICGIISGGLGAVLAISISTNTGLNNTIISVLLSAFISSFTVGGKAIMKQVAVRKSNKILSVVGKIMHIFSFKGR